MIRRWTFLRGIGLTLAVAACAAIAWSQTARRKPVEQKPVEETIQRRTNPAALVDDGLETMSKPVLGGPGRPTSKTKVDDSDPDFEVIRPLHPVVVTIRLKVGKDPARATTSGAGIVVDGRGYILTLASAVNGEAGDEEEPADEDQDQRISGLFAYGTEFTAKIVDTDASLGLSLLKVELPTRYPAIDVAGARRPIDRERVFLVPQQLRERTLTGRVTSSSVSFPGVPTVFECNFRLPEGEGGSLLITEAGDPIGIMTDKFAGKKTSYGIPLESARHFIEQRIAEHEEDLQRKSSPRRRPDSMPSRAEPIPTRRPLPPETLVLMGQRGAAEIEADKVAATIRELLASLDPVPESIIKEHRRKLNDLLRQAFDLKVQVEEAQLREFRSRLDRLEQQIDQRKAVRDKIVEQRAAELLSDQNIKWPSDPPDQNEAGFERPDPRAHRRAPGMSNPNDRRRGGRMPSRTRPPVDSEPESLDDPRSEVVPADSTERDPGPDLSLPEKRDEVAPIGEAVNPPRVPVLAASEERDELPPIGEAPAQAADAADEDDGARLTVHLRLEDPPEGKQPAKKQPKQSAQIVRLSGRSLNYERVYSNVLLDDLRGRDFVFQKLEPGHYTLSVLLTEGAYRSMTRPVFVRDEKPAELTVNCPRLREPATLLMTIPPFPKELLAEDVQGRLDCRIASTVRTLPIDGSDWASDESDDRTITFDVKTGQAIHFTRMDGKTRREFVTEMKDLEDKDRLIFLDSGSYSVSSFTLTVWGKRGTVTSQHDNSYVEPGGKSAEIHAINAGENRWELAYPENVLEQARKAVKSLKGQSE
jgi:S1-C subfamily serine protease